MVRSWPTSLASEPTARQDAAAQHEIPFHVTVVDEVCAAAVHAPPASSAATPSPTAVHVPAAGQSTTDRPFGAAAAVTAVVDSDQAPPARVSTIGPLGGPEVTPTAVHPPVQHETEESQPSAALPGRVARDQVVPSSVTATKCVASTPTATQWDAEVHDTEVSCGGSPVWAPWSSTCTVQRPPCSTAASSAPHWLRPPAAVADPTATQVVPAQDVASSDELVGPGAASGTRARCHGVAWSATEPRSGEREVTTSASTAARWICPTNWPTWPPLRELTLSLAEFRAGFPRAPGASRDHR